MGVWYLAGWGMQCKREKLLFPTFGDGLFVGTREWWKMKQIASHIPLAIRLFFWKIAQFWWCQIVLTNENDLPKKEFLPKKTAFAKFFDKYQNHRPSHHKSGNTHTPIILLKATSIILSKMTSISNQNSLQKDSFGSWIQLRKSRWRAIARIPI